jgi:uncharacterized membrane protein
MFFEKLAKYQYKIIIGLSLTLASLASIVLVCLRYLHTQELTHAGLVWNLFLAWIPFLFSMIAYYYYQKPKKNLLLIYVSTFIWFIFFPNAPYILTDFVHLSSRDGVPLWYDLILILSFALTGYFLGFLSLYLVHNVVREAFGKVTAWIFALFAIFSGSFGVYLGRFLRWNSWDVFVNPRSLLVDILDRIIRPDLHLKTLIVTILFTFLFMFSYVIIYALTFIGHEENMSLKKR